MGISVLEFKLHNELFCLNTDYIDYVFELDSFSELNTFCECVVGITKYNDDVMLLIDTANLYTDKNLDFSTPKSVIVIKDEDKKHYGLVVDEIIKIEDVEVALTGIKMSSKQSTINHYKAKDVIMNEINPFGLLKSKNIPSMSKVKSKTSLYEDLLSKERSDDYLLFKISDKNYALKGLHVKEVIQNDNSIFELKDKQNHIKGAMAIRDEIVKIVKIEEATNSEDIIIVEDKEAKFGIEVDEIIDIKSFDVSKFEKVKDAGFISSFYNYNGEVVAIVKPSFFTTKSQVSYKDSSNETVKEKSEKISYLVFEIENKNFCIEMDCVRKVAQSDDLHKTNSSAFSTSDSVDFITSWDNKAISVMNLDKFLNVTSKKEDSQVIFVEVENKLNAFIVDDIKDIIIIDKNDINVSNDNGALIKGAVIFKNKALAVLNEKILITLG